MAETADALPFCPWLPRFEGEDLPRIRCAAEDFTVEERVAWEPEGEGQHTYLWVEKRLLNTEEAAHLLARAAGVDAREVGYAGRKDRRAVTRQWISVPGLEPEAAPALEIPGLQVLRAERAGRKLRPGMLEGNRFSLVVRNVSATAAERAGERLEELSRRGLPNRFGRQRFGSDGRNVRLGATLLRGGRVHCDRRTRKFMLSAIQAAVFNEVLARRRPAVDEVEKGDLVVVHTTGRLELVEDSSEHAESLARFEISPTGPLFGFKARQPGHRVAVAEHAVLEQYGLGDLYGLRLPKGLRLFGGRRALRAPVGEVCSHFEDGRLRLDFELPSGSYATVLLEELFPGGFVEERAREPARASAPPSSSSSR